MGKRLRMTRHQVVVLETMQWLDTDEEIPQWYAPRVFWIQCKYPRPLATLTALERKGFVEQKRIKQMDLERGVDDLGPEEWFRLTDGGINYLDRRKRFFDTHPWHRRMWCDGDTKR